MQYLDQVTINDDKSVATVGPGSKWINVYKTLDQYGVSVVGGRGPTVGAGGFMLGAGGYFHWTGKYGMAADNVKDFEIVLANGTITNANAENNTDLFWALKGGGPNFGIVTKMDLYTIPIRNIWYQFGTYDSNQAPALIEAYAKWQNDGASDTRGTVGFVIGLETTFVGLFWSEPAEKPEPFAPFYNITQIEPAGTPTNSTLMELTNQLAFIGSEGSARHDYRAATAKVDVELYNDVYEFWKPKAQAVHNATGANVTFVFQPVPKSVAAASEEKGGNPMGITAEDQMWWSTTLDWTDAADDDTVRGLSIETTDKWEELGKARGSYLPHLFMNDASRDQNPLASYGEENLQKLKDIAAKYDPTQLFQEVQNSGFLLSKA
ncbi:FAD-binding domain-containing protein [Massarina eburnea CBS 473.64]|uniref:FAD-binding domain-containing protein n=1 Tax=Massarina eburnea CBS 473.64 TaxID=1395130 RepID=A0A6A6SKU7_9PLEO|nr:FAD-binding domain-containing protein [Massarina eburnea CBS 473.64]